jgi:uncharacterized membrane protein
VAVNNQRRCAALYWTFAFAAVAQFNLFLAAFSVGAGLLFACTLVGIISLIFAYRGMAQAEGTDYHSHYRWLIRSFWIGNLVYQPLVLGVAAYLMVSAGVFTESRARDASLAAFAHAKMTVTILWFSMPLPLWWWIRRCVPGYLALRRDQPVENVGAWI